MSQGYWNPTRRIIADGALSELPEAAAEFHPKKVLLVTGRSSFSDSPHYRKLSEGLSSFKQVGPLPVEHNPSVLFVEQMWRSLAGQGIDLVIGIGGGSVIDCAKAVRILLAQEDKTPDLESYVSGRNRFQRRGLPFIAVPTTAGTGSEVTPYASLQTGEQRKISLTHPWLFPDVALVDPLLTHTLPPYVTACSGLDALSQAVESFWSLHHTAFSETHSLRAITLILENFEKVLADPADSKARFAMSAASTEAGLAITQTRTTAVHAVSYPLTTFYDIAHGHACALTLPSFIRYNAPALEPARADLLWKTLGAPSAEEAARRVEQLIDRGGLERSLRKLGLKAEGIERVIENGFRSDRVVNNPRVVTQDALREILAGIF